MSAAEAPTATDAVTTATLAPANGDSDRRLRVLMYHKVNDLPGNPLSVPVGVFDEQMAQLRELAYTVVALDDVLEYYANAAELPSRSVLITFDDGYRDNLENAMDVLRRYGYPAVLFVPIGLLVGAALSALLHPSLAWLLIGVTAGYSLSGST